MPVALFVIVFIILAASGGEERGGGVQPAREQERAAAEADAVFRKDRRLRFIDEVNPDVFVVKYYRDMSFAAILGDFLASYGYTLVWDASLDCAAKIGFSVRGRTVEEVLSKTAKNFHVVISIYQNRHVVVEPNTLITASCGRHRRINYQPKGH